MSDPITPPHTVRHAAELRLQQPVTMSRGPRGDTPQDTYKHVPGTTLRGALAFTWILENGEPQHASRALRQEFVHLFEGGVRYGPLFDPASDVVPLSVRTCKYRPQHGCLGFFTDHAKTANGKTACETCDGPVQAGRGDVEFFGTGAGVVATTHVSLDGDERATDGQLFTSRALAAQVNGAQRVLAGEVFASDDPRSDWLRKEHAIRVGGRRSVLGASVFEARREPAGNLNVPSLHGHDGALLLRLLSPAILVDAAGRPTQWPDASVLAGLLGVRNVRVRRGSWVRTERAGGWNKFLDLPKPTELVVCAGSVYALDVDGTVDEAGLRRLLAHGIGIRRPEGYGHIALGPWKTPPLVPPSEPERKERMPDGVARLLAETGEGAWFLDKLREVQRERRRGKEADLRFLTLRRAEALITENERLPRYIEILAKGDMADLEVSLTHLESRVRELRKGKQS